jgi:hypothetical protein
MQIFKKSLLILLIVSSLFMLSGGLRSQEIISAQSSWTNTEGSVLFIDKIDKTSGKITGHYINKAEGYPCRSTPYPLTGWIMENTITFSVIWQNETETCQALTTWIGIIDGNKISTKWHFADHSMSDVSEIKDGVDSFELNE